VLLRRGDTATWSQLLLLLIAEGCHQLLLLLLLLIIEGCRQLLLVVVGGGGDVGAA
jgi:hypothetical protein